MSDDVRVYVSDGEESRPSECHAAIERGVLRGDLEVFGADVGQRLDTSTRDDGFVVFHPRVPPPRKPRRKRFTDG